MTIPKNLEVARGARLAPLGEIAADVGIGGHLLEPYGEGVAKIKLDAIEELSSRPQKPRSEPSRLTLSVLLVIVSWAADPVAAAWR